MKMLDFLKHKWKHWNLFKHPSLTRQYKTPHDLRHTLKDSLDIGP